MERQEKTRLSEGRDTKQVDHQEKEMIEGSNVYVSSDEASKEGERSR